MDEQMKSDKKCGCGCCHHSVVPALAVLIGLDFLLGALGVFSAGTVAVIWPILLIVGAGTKMFARKCKCC
jgi:hypothetical protein